MASPFRKALVVGAHPDDEVLGCGGFIARLLEEGCEVRVLILGSVTTSRAGNDFNTAEQYSNEMERALKVLGVQSFRRMDFPDNRFDTLPLINLAQAVEAERENFAPDLVLTHDPYDLNVDHRRTHEAVLIAFRPSPGFSPLCLWSFEVLSSTEWQDPLLRRFQPQVYMDISRQLEKKLRAMECYASELRDYPHPRSLEGIRTLARLRGLEACLMAAEAFRVVREIR